MCPVIMIIRMKERKETATKVQETLTKYGCSISVRLGLHDSAGDSCSNNGVVILRLCGDPEDQIALEEALNQIDGIRAKSINIDEM